MLQLDHAKRARLKTLAKSDLKVIGQNGYVLYASYFILYGIIVVGYLGLLHLLNSNNYVQAIPFINTMPPDRTNFWQQHYQAIKTTIKFCYIVLSYLVYNATNTAFYNMLKDKQVIKTPLDALKPLLTRKYSGIYKLSIRQSIAITLWSLCLYVPGIIKKYAYSQSSFLMASALDSNHKTSAKVAMRQSESLMEGHKFEYLCLRFSLLGWYFLSAITFGIGLIWLIPYKTALYMRYFEYLVADKQIRLNTEIKNCPKWYNARPLIKKQKPKKIPLTSTEREAIAARIDQHFYDNYQNKTVGDMIQQVNHVSLDDD